MTTTKDEARMFSGSSIIDVEGSAGPQKPTTTTGSTSDDLRPRSASFDDSSVVNNASSEEVAERGSITPKRERDETLPISSGRAHALGDSPTKGAGRRDIIESSEGILSRSCIPSDLSAPPPSSTSDSRETLGKHNDAGSMGRHSAHNAVIIERHSTHNAVIQRHSTHGASTSNSAAPVNSAPLKAIRRSWKPQTQNADVPPSFGRSLEKKSSKELKKSSLKQQPQSIAESTEDGKGSSPSKMSWRPPKPPSPSSDTSDVDPSPPRRKISSQSDSELSIDFVRINTANDDRSKVSTYNSLLKEIAFSEKPEAQRALNVLATMKRNGVTPDETTWSYVEKCSEVVDDDEEDQEVVPSELLGGFDGEVSTLSLSLYTDGSFDQSSDDDDFSGQPRRRRRSWRSDQELADLPPAFRSSILAMLRKKSSRRLLSDDDDDSPPKAERQAERKLRREPRRANEIHLESSILKTEMAQNKPLDEEDKNSSKNIQQEVAMLRSRERELLVDDDDSPKAERKFRANEKPLAKTPPPGTKKEGESSILKTTGMAPNKPLDDEVIKNPSINIRYEELRGLSPFADRTKRWSSKVAEIGKANNDIVAVKQPPVQEPPSVWQTSFVKHGVVQYMRPDGMGYAARLKVKGEEPADIEDELASIDSSDLKCYNKLLATIAESSLPDRANRAGKVLRNMKEYLVAPDNTTKDLLAECSRVEEGPIEPKIHEVQIQIEEEIVFQEPKPGDQHTSPIRVIKKKVRFSDTNKVRIIRRRRSISSMERWDDPLTPPKRVSQPIDLAPARFSGGVRDDRPSLPRRSESLSSLLSGGSGGSDFTGSSSEGDDSYMKPPPVTDRFKLPFSDASPQATSRKGNKNVPVGGHVLAIPRRTEDSSLPMPKRSDDVDGPPRPPRRPPGWTRKTRPTGRAGNADSSNKALGIPPAPIGSPVLSSPPPPIPSTVLSSPPPPIGIPVLYTPPMRRRIKRRGSIGGTERSAAPLTPPRKISAPLHIFIAQQSLRKTKSADDAILFSPAAKKDEIQPLTCHSTHSMPPRMDEAKPARLRQAKPKPYISTSQHDRTSSQQPPPQSVFESPVARHQQTIAEHWRTIDLPAKMRMKGLDDSVHESQPALGTISMPSRSFDAVESEEKRIKRAGRRFSAGVTPSWDSGRARAGDHSTGLKPPEAPWSRVKLKSTGHSEAIKKGAPSKAKSNLSNMSDHGAMTTQASKNHGEANEEGKVTRKRHPRRVSLPL